MDFRALLLTTSSKDTNLHAMKQSKCSTVFNLNFFNECVRYGWIPNLGLERFRENGGNCFYCCYEQTSNLIIVLYLTNFRHLTANFFQS